MILIAGALLLRKSAVDVELVYRQLLDILPYTALGLAAALCVYFNRARPFTAALVFLLTYYLVQVELQTSLAGPRPYTYTAMSVLLSFTIWLLMLLPERCLRNCHGGMMVAVVLYRSYPPAELVAAINTWLPIYPLAKYVLSTNASMVFAVAVITNLYILLKQDSEWHAALLALLACGFVTLAGFDQPGISTLMYSVAGI